MKIGYGLAVFVLTIVWVGVLGVLFFSYDRANDLETMSRGDFFTVSFLVQFFLSIFFVWLSYSSLYIYSLKHNLDIKQEYEKQFKKNRIRTIITVTMIVIVGLSILPVKFGVYKIYSSLFFLTLAGIILVLLILQLFNIFMEILRGNIFPVLLDVALLFTFPMVLFILWFSFELRKLLVVA